MSPSHAAAGTQPSSTSSQLPHNRSTMFTSFYGLVTMLAVALAAAAWSLFYRTASAVLPDSDCNHVSVSVVTATCRRLHTLLGPSVITLPTDAGYIKLTEENWSQTAWQRPTCVAEPASAEEVATLVKQLVSSSVPFAIRSGGHSPNPLDATIKSGVLISLSNLDEVSYDYSTKLASVGPGALWEHVYTQLDKHNVTVVGGRVLPVGVGGLTLGSGLSYLSDLHGLVCDNVVGYEVVLANGTIVDAGVGSHSDLFWALKGGLNNFGIVTRFIFFTHPNYHTWGGMQVFTVDQMPALLHALYEYQTTPNKDLYANLIINLIPTNGTLMLTLVYLKPVERPAAYAPFYALKPVFEKVGFMTLHQTMAMFPPATLPRWTWYVHGFKPADTLYDKLATLFQSAPEVSQMAKLQGGSLIAAVQPISASAVLAGRASNGGIGNALGLQAVNQTWMSISGAWYKAQDDAKAHAAVVGMWKKVGMAVGKAGTAVEYLFMNDAYIAQPVIKSYGRDNVARLQAVQRQYDPNLVFRRLVPGGQKIPA